MAPDESRASAQRAVLLAVVLCALLASGVSGLMNQVVWQRALKVFLGGSETLSSMVVVLVFMLGLGIGAFRIGSRIEKTRNPLRTLALIELWLFGVNVLIALVLSMDLTESVYAVQRLAVSIGIPRRAVYAVGAILILLPPTFLMGATIPVASDVCQRQLIAGKRRTITYLFFINTAGAAVGAFAASFYLLPYYGQRFALIGAAVCNLVAGLGLLVFASTAPRCEPATTRSSATTTDNVRLTRMTLEESMGLFLGFLSLGYEFYLFRIVALAHLPLPYTFAMTLCFFLLFWSLGVYLANFLRENIPALLLVGGVLVAAMPWVYELDRFEIHFRLFAGALAYFVPCVFFGLLYGYLVSRSAQEWGRDVGRFFAVNTAGSCLGILFFTLVGYEIQHHYNAFVIALGLLFSCTYYLFRVATPQPVKFGRSRRLLIVGTGAASLAAIVVFVGVGLRSPYTMEGESRTFWGRDGVVEVTSGEVYLDGLWHSALANQRPVAGRWYTWWMAVAGYLAHDQTPVRDVLIIGYGVGITAETIALKDDVKIDAYEINHTLKSVNRAYAAEIPHAASHPRINIMWQDGRSGLALSSKRYDLIISAPLHLKQAGSSLLLSREYLQLVKKRLKPGGVVVLYSHEGPAAQAQLIQNTVATVFGHTHSFIKTLITVASDMPMKLDSESVEAKLAADDPLMNQALAYIRKHGLPYDGPFSRHGSYIITDDHPLVEYPDVAVKLVELP